MYGGEGNFGEEIGLDVSKVTSSITVNGRYFTFLGQRAGSTLKENNKPLESWIWDAACSIRGAKDAPKYKDYILSLIFTKRLCDVFDDELNRIGRGRLA